MGKGKGREGEKEKGAEEESYCVKALFGKTHERKQNTHTHTKKRRREKRRVSGKRNSSRLSIVIGRIEGNEKEDNGKGKDGCSHRGGRRGRINSGSDNETQRGEEEENTNSKTERNRKRTRHGGGGV